MNISWTVLKLQSGHDFGLRNCFLQVQRDTTKQIHKQELWFFHSARRHMMLNICMKFHEDILKCFKVIGFKVTERTRFCHRNSYLQSSRGHNSKIHIQELRFLCSARCPMLVNIYMKFHEDILNGFKVIERTRFCHRNCYLQSSKGHNSKIYPRVMVLALCTSSNVG